MITHHLKVKAIFFDLGGVILKHRADLIGFILSQMFPISKEEGDRIFHEYRIRLLTGKLSSREFLQQVKEKKESEDSIDKLCVEWLKLYEENAQIDWELLDFVTELRKKYKVYLLTDTIDIHDQFNKNRGIYNKFDRVFKSFEEKLSKAEGPEFYLRVLKAINLEANQCVNIDDLEENIKTAESIGIKGILFQNSEQIKKELNTLL